MVFGVTSYYVLYLSLVTLYVNYQRVILPCESAQELHVIFTFGLPHPCRACMHLHSKCI
jgi:hypothetical protein